MAAHYIAHAILTLCCFLSPPPQMTVKDWLHTADFTVPEQATALDVFLRKQQELDWAAWSVLSPFRSHDKTQAVVKSLVHHVAHHLRVGRQESCPSLHMRSASNTIEICVWHAVCLRVLECSGGA